jgi:hypothetical protein
MQFDYPCLYDYIKEDFTLIACVQSIFDEIQTESQTASGHVFEDYDAELKSELAFSYYFERAKRPLKVLYFQYCKNAVDWADTDSIKSFFTHLGKVAYSRFGANWESIYKAYFLTAYKPLENYDMEQVRTPLLDTTNTTTRKQETKVETSGKTSVVPFNSTTPTLTGESEGDSTTTEDKTKNEVEGTITERGTDTLTRRGNIGVMSSQRLLTEELELRKLDFVKRVFEDIDKVLLRSYMPGGNPWIL